VNSGVVAMGNRHLDCWLSSRVEAVGIEAKNVFGGSKKKKRKRTSGGTGGSGGGGGVVLDVTTADTRRVLDAATSLSKWLTSDAIGE
jgi:hypothetical protein